MELKPSSKNAGSASEIAATVSLHDLDYDSIEQLLVQYAAETNLVSEWQTPVVARPPSPLRKKKRKLKEPPVCDRKSVSSYNDGLWCDSVEKYSYRYIPNNGCYRSIKQQANQPRPTFSQRKPSEPMGSAGAMISQEHKALRRELTHDLRREFHTLMETNRSYFRIQDSEVEQLEDEEDFKVKSTQLISPPPVFVKLNPLPQTARVQETQSAQPTYRLEDLIINKRCSTTLDNPTKEHKSVEKSSPKNEPRERLSDEKLQKKLYPSLHANYQIVNKEQFELLAQRTFNFQRIGNSEKQEKPLKPIEKITPSMRELCDNSRAENDLVKFGYSQAKEQSSDLDIAVSSITSLNQRTTEFTGTGFDNQRNTKNVVAIKNTENSSMPVAPKLGESRTKCSVLKRVAVNLKQQSDDFQSFLPSISGKRISSKLSSTIKLTHHIHH